jgi:hypothetical protein
MHDTFSEHLFRRHSVLSELLGVLFKSLEDSLCESKSLEDLGVERARLRSISNIEIVQIICFI